MNYFGYDRLCGQIAALTERAWHAEFRAEKAEARVAELEAQVAAWSPARCYGEEDETYDGICPDCSVVGAVYDETDSAGVVRNRVCGRCGSAWQVDAKTAPKTPVPAPEPTETVRNQAPAAGTGPSRHDPPARGVAAGVEPAPVPGDPRASELMTWIELFRLGTAYDRCGVCRKVGSDRFNTTCRACKIAFPHNARGGKCDPLIACPICTGRIPDPSGPYPTTATPEADAFRVYDEMLRNPGHPQRGLTAEEADAWTELLGKFVRPAATTRVEASPAAAAEVEARTGEVALKKQAEIWRDAVLESIPKRRCEGCANGTALAAHSLCPSCVAKSEAAAIGAYDATLRRWAEFFTPPRAGLPSRDEVAAFLAGEALNAAIAESLGKPKLTPDEFANHIRAFANEVASAKGCCPWCDARISK